jgi:hypothetical protein
MRAGTVVSCQAEAEATLDDCIFALELTAVSLKGSDGKCRAARCSCADVPNMIWQLEQHRPKLVTRHHKALSEALCIALAKLAAVLLKGGHRERAFRRTTDAFDR